ncbi:MAG: type VII toxin-antitoxin system HepT family RNase toxin [Planctomycetota bacterium]
MPDRDALSTRLAALETYLREIRSLAKHDREEFAATPALHHLAERYLHLACEYVLDTAHHVIAEMGYRQPESYRDAMDVLRENGHLDEPLAERLKAWVGLRNVLVRFYLTVDHGRVHDAMRNDLGGLTAFAQRMAPLLGSDVPG